jgi:Zn-dependent peptidase ImmA (M78 family)
MKHLLRRAQSFGIGLRPQGERDFFRICDAEGIEIIWSDNVFSFYFTSYGKPFIVLPKKLKGLELLFKMFHELGHVMCHAEAEVSVMWSDMPTHNDREEAEADAFALVAIIPKPFVGRTDFLETYSRTFARKVYNERLRLAFLYDL